MGVTLDAWLTALQALLPPGRALSTEPGALLTRLLQAVAARLLSLQSALEHLQRQMDPRAATDLLPDWEALLGLPDACAPQDQGTLARQQTAFGRLTEIGGQSRAYFIDLAARNGEPGVTITEFRPFTCNGTCNGNLGSVDDAFVWRVNIPRAVQSVQILTCQGDCNDALQSYTPAAIECFFNHRKPAHTNVVFAYAA